jgi:hypothetical protein
VSEGPRREKTIRNINKNIAQQKGFFFGLLCVFGLWIVGCEVSAVKFLSRSLKKAATRSHLRVAPDGGAATAAAAAAGGALLRLGGAATLAFAHGGRR